MGDQKQNLNAEVQRNVLELAIKQLLWNVKAILPHPAGDEMIYGEGGEMPLLVETQSTCEKYLCFCENAFREYLCDELRAVWNCYACRLSCVQVVDFVDKSAIEIVLKEKVWS